MKKYFLLSIMFISSLFIAEEIFASSTIERIDNPSQITTYPFSTDTSHFTHWNGNRYVPFSIKGMNLGISVPGTFPGELAATETQYWNWFLEMKEAGYNVVRLYTLHYPHFYTVLDSFNLKYPENPLYFIQGVWLEEELPGYNQDLFFNAPSFKLEIEENIDCVHGNKTISHRFGKAYGTYTKDASKWCMAYLIGREVSNWEIQTTNANHLDKTAYSGTYLSIADVNAAEVFVTQRLDSLLIYEQDNYNTQRPVAYSSWPTLDPLTHPTEVLTDEDSEKLELAEMDFTNAKAGFYVSYHAYPYYPDFISRDTLYQEFTDEYGPNTYLGYLSYLKEHYQGIPLLIAEFGLPSSWGVAHYSKSGMNHGGNDELMQGESDYRMFKSFVDANCAGGIQFAWIDEWFKRTWICDPFDYSVDDRVMWQNVAAAEQNFGIIGFRKDTLDWETLASYSGAEPIDSVEASIDHAFFNVKLHLNKSFNNLDTLWLAFDTYDASLGEKVLISGDTLENGAEFLLRIANDAADLFVTEAYDLYGIWHGISPVAQKYQSTATVGAPWNLVRWKNNDGEQEVQYIGHLKVNRLDLPSTSMDAVSITSDSIMLRIPWSLLQFVNPAYKTVMHDDRSTSTVRETAFSDGVSLAIKYKGALMDTIGRFTWPSWNNFNDLVEYKKDSYYFLKENLPLLPGCFVAIADNYQLISNTTAILDDASVGLMSNDLLLENGRKETVLIDPPYNGFINVQSNGTFTYIPDTGYEGEDSFTYKVIGQWYISDTATVRLVIEQGSTDSGMVSQALSIYPNPAKDYIKISSELPMQKVWISDVAGAILLSKTVNDTEHTVLISSLPIGAYIVFVRINDETLARKIIVE